MCGTVDIAADGASDGDESHAVGRGLELLPCRGRCLRVQREAHAPRTARLSELAHLRVELEPVRADDDPPPRESQLP